VSTGDFPDIGKLIQIGDDFANHLRQVKSETQGCDFEWYRYDSMGNLNHLDVLLQGPHRDLRTLAGGAPVLDFGCADGDFAFLLESLGLPVIAFDHGRTNHNGMKGVRALKQELGSKVEVCELDLDSGFQLPPGEFGLAVVLGILYHLKNPFYVLESIARQARYCLLSTRITRYLPDRKTDVSRSPVAYLLGETELNDDNSNFWIFSEAGLRRIVERAHWRVIHLITVGPDASDPVSLDHDQRAFCLLESVHGMRHLDLLDGWYPAEADGWRWTAKEFSLRVDSAGSIALEMYVPPELIARCGSLTLWAEANGVALGGESFRASGKAMYVRSLPSGPLDLRFRLSDSFPPTAVDARELGIIVARLDVD
jgi:2-polyprenyl-3-methyl-5-hydroxy-6-metoxy-1,4-benzoquinol methylase